CCLALACITDLTHAFLPPLFFLLTPRPPRSTLFPYTTLFRSQGDRQRFVALHQEMQTGEKEGCQRLNAVGRHRTFSGRHAQSDGNRKSTRLNSSHVKISYAVFCLKKKKKKKTNRRRVQSWSAA